MDEATVSTLSRRNCLSRFASAAALLTGAAVARPAAATPVVRPRRRALRIAQLSDIHVHPEAPAAAGMAACLHHVQSLRDRPDVIFNSGDAIYDSIEQDDYHTKQQWDLWHAVLRAELDQKSLPMEHLIGNHDVWGLNRTKSHTTGAEPLYGKRRALDALSLDQRYRSFDRAGWHFVFLDSTMPLGHGYAAKLDEEQHEWLADDLAKTDRATPVCIVSHIPIFSAAVFLSAGPEWNYCYMVPALEMHSDFRRLQKLFKQHPNVRLCLSGHLHLHERVDYLGVTYLCAGAVSGNWWKGRYKDDCDPGYMLLDLFDDGTFAHEYVTYAAPAPIAGAQ